LKVEILRILRMLKGGGKVVGRAARDLLLNLGIYQKIYHGMVMLFHDFLPSYIMSLLTEFCLISDTRSERQYTNSIFKGVK